MPDDLNFHYRYFEIALFLFFTIEAFISSCFCKAVMSAVRLLTVETRLMKFMEFNMEANSFAFESDSISTKRVCMDSVCQSNLCIKNDRLKWIR